LKKKKHLYGWLGLSEQTTANLLQEDSMPFQDRGSVWVDKEANLQQVDSMPLQDQGSVWVDKEAKLQQESSMLLQDHALTRPGFRLG
jgi:hypothetical protein